MLNQKITDDAECGIKINFFMKVKVKGLSHKCIRVLHENMLLPVLIYSSETMMWDSYFICLKQIDRVLDLVYH